MKKSKKLPKLPRPNLKKPNLKALPRPLKRRKSAEDKVTEALVNVPRITNETVAEHREEVLSSARKYIYPLQHSKHRVVRTSISLLIIVLIGFFVFCNLELYKFQNTSSFMYGVTRVLPFPVAKAGSHWVSYESYLFELRRNMHYYQTQQQANFATKDGKAQLARLKQQALSQVIQNGYVSQLAAQHNVKVSDQAVATQVSLVRTENRLGSNDRVFKDVLSQFWGWSEADFNRELKEQLLQQAVVTKLDTATQAKAQNALKQLQAGADFGTLASQISDDPATKASGGQYGTAITASSTDIPPAITAELLKLKAGQISGIINTQYTLDIVKVIDTDGTTVHAAHIQFTLADITTYTKPLQAKHPTHSYIKF